MRCRVDDEEELNVRVDAANGAFNEIDCFSDNQDVVEEAEYDDCEDSSDTNQVPD